MNLRTSLSTPIRIGTLVPLVLLLALGGCGSDKSPVSPGVNPEIVNATDNFQFQVTNVRNFTESWDYTWSNTGVMAVADHSSSVTGGSATLTLLDDAGTEVYSRDLAVDGSFNSTSGQTGSWTVRVSLSGASGTFNFRVDKATP
jgi:hypothetical protein